MRITHYLSGPMSGIEGNNFPAFEAACQQLRRRGFDIRSPHEKGSELDTSTPYVEYLRQDIAMMTAECQSLILLPGWPASNGARMELAIALTLRWPIYFYRPFADELISMTDGGRLFE